MPAEITRNFVTIGDRQVMYRSAGHGPPVLLLHQSPKSSEEHLPLIDLLSVDFTVLAPDTPGFGLSDPILSDPESTPIDVIAVATVEFLDALGIGKVGLYGIHTGASIATRLTRLFPERVHCLIANGTLVLTPEEKADMLAYYFVPFVPKWDGSHLTWLWARLREQMIFFPWYRKDPKSRLNYPAPSAERLHHDALDLLNSGDAHRIAYRGAIAYDKAADMADVTPPTMYVCAETDVLMQYAHRFPKLPSTSRFVAVPTPADIFAKTAELFRELVPKTEAPKLPEAAAVAGRLASRFVRIGGKDIRVRFAEGPRGPTVIVIHELGASGASAPPWIDAVIGKNPVILPDLPGHGDTGATDTDLSLEALITPVKALISDIKTPIDIWAVGDAAILGATLVMALGKRANRLILCDPFLPDGENAAQYTPDLSPSYEGAHLSRAWMAARDRWLFWPHFNTLPDGILRQAAIIDDTAVHRRTIDLLKAEPVLKPLTEAMLAASLATALKGLPVPLKVVASPWLSAHPLFQQRAEAAGLTITPLTGAPETWHDQI